MLTSPSLNRNLNLQSNHRVPMNDWAPSIIASALFALLTPGLILQMPGRPRPVDFLNMKTSWASIFVHAVVFGVLLMLFLVILHPHLYL
ncbi:hypothetical protein HPP92_021200 [Vanilla planifolia]|uniref:Uncharacterized protein n=1 Tax=Vanilla planifolia TaxID=51239 RepID=A0A835UH83_VANPL|nr:hypothetical protein HPP92_021570 [Vanilla planifolia]KAG0462724.1 hypothetical protein HPP92_021200 [Vanilla planifolia]